MRLRNIAIRWIWCLCVIGALLFTGFVAMPVRAATAVVYVNATGHYMRGVFRDFWDKHNGMTNFGYPITEEYIDPGTGRVYQYFERARFERAQASSTTVELGLLGKLAVGERVFPTAAPITNTSQRRYFPETQHIVQYGFKEIWDARGGLAIFGLPLSEEVDEQLSDGKVHQVQYFERARFEYWPDLSAGQRVLLSLLGRQFAPVALTAPLAPNAPPVGPITIGDSGSAPSAPAAGPSLVRPILPENKDALVLPQAGQPGQVFYFNAIGFHPGEHVGIWLNTPDGSIIGARFQAIADDDGSITNAQISYQTGQDAPLGIWSFVAQGIKSNVQSVGYFLLIGDAIGRLPEAEPKPNIPQNVNARAEPSSGRAGTIFFFDAYGFQAGEDVALAVVASDGTRIEASYAVKADAQGSIRYAGLYYVTEVFYPLGVWRFEAKGKTSGRLSIAYFVLTD